MIRFLLVCSILFTHTACAPDDVSEVRNKTLQEIKTLELAKQFNLGLRYELGEGVPKDDAEALRWYRRAAEQGYAVAQLHLGLMYANGEGVPEDDTEALRWYRRAAEQGNFAAQYYLGLIYDLGEGAPEDDVQAYAWLSIAAAQDLDDAKEAKEIVANAMTSAQIAEAQKLSRKYWEAYGPER